MQLRILVLGKITGDAVNIRTSGSTSSAIIGLETYGDVFPVLASENGWFKISYGDAESAWVCGSYMEVSPVTNENNRGTVSGDYVNIRSGASTVHSVLATVPYGTKLTVLGEENGWYNVSVNGVTGFIRCDYLVFGLSERAATGKGSSAVVDEAMRHVGKAYVYGATGPNAFDCSGFTQYVYKQLGYSLNRTAASQMSNGVPVDRASLLPGDLVFFSNNGSSITHVGICIGNNQMVHASTSRTGVIISDLNSDYYVQRYAGARRIIN